jgi:hypothetical protein
VATLVARNAKEAMMVPMVGSGEVAVRMSSHLAYFTKLFYTFCTSNKICDLQRKCCKKLHYCSPQQMSILVNFGGRTLA